MLQTKKEKIKYLEELKEKLQRTAPRSNKVRVFQIEEQLKELNWELGRVIRWTEESEELKVVDK